VDAPGGGGKIPVMPQYMISQSPGKVVFRNYEGYITTYDEPTDYDPGLIDHLDRQFTSRHEAGQSGVSGLLEGEAAAIKPEGFDNLHKRGGAPHRLNADAAKWERYKTVPSDEFRVQSEKQVENSHRSNSENGDENETGEFADFSNGHTTNGKSEK
jgi:hypothetical protein